MNINNQAKRILCYGDSITWGRKCDSFERWEASKRWTGVMQAELGNRFEVIEEGLRARMAKGENPFFPDRDGYSQFGPIYGSQVPIDLVLLLLGTNDTNSKSNKTAPIIANEIGSYIELTEKWSRQLEVKTPKIMLVSPPIIRDDKLKDTTMFSDSEMKSKELGRHLLAVAEKRNAYFFDAAEIVSAGDDGVHLDVLANKALGKALAKKIKTLNI